MDRGFRINPLCHKSKVIFLYRRGHGIIIEGTKKKKEKERNREKSRFISIRVVKIETRRHGWPMAANLSRLQNSRWRDAFVDGI